MTETESKLKIFLSNFKYIFPYKDLVNWNLRL